MLKKVLFSTLFTIIGLCSFSQSGQYIAILESGYCIDASTNPPTYSYYTNPKIIIIDPIGTITETPLIAPSSMQDVLDHTVQFNIAVSNILNQGYTISNDNGSADAYLGVMPVASNLNFQDAKCSGGTMTGSFGISVTLVACCDP